VRYVEQSNPNLIESLTYDALSTSDSPPRSGPGGKDMTKHD
jgi:hypothetical protein